MDRTIRPSASPWCGSNGRACWRGCPISRPSFRSAPASITSSATRTFRDVPIVRVVADDLTLRMSEYVVWQVLDHLRQGRIYREQQQRKIWREPYQPAASDVTVGIMGLGVLGTDAALKLAAMGFKVGRMEPARKACRGRLEFPRRRAVAGLRLRFRHPRGALAADACHARHRQWRVAVEPASAQRRSAGRCSSMPGAANCRSRRTSSPHWIGGADGRQP